ncbi:NEDD8-activating enzyme E1 regulatory subunit-like [Clavelina lepadiformis]|uniref:NEDD8-activating enzyme E1 regulatory subunit-like n=1 Tax=Clavelina lepadiformis TaxID=159417 RepID=UPI00404112FA
MEWKKAHSGAMPKTWKEKKEFKKLVMSGIRKNADGVPEDEENFDEAVKQVNSALVPSCVPAKVQKIFNDPKCLQITEESTDFWMMVGGLRQFVSNSENGLLPLRGSLPDMFSDSDKYIKLQNIYQGKAKQDMEAVTGHISQVCTKSGCGNGKISEKDIKRFCRNAHFLRVVRTRSLQSEYESPSKSIMDCLTSDEISDAVWYVLLRAVERFQSTNGRLPGMNNAEWESDVNRLKNCLYDLLKSWDIPGAVEAISDDFLQMCRCGSSEIHSVASYMGGVTSHEVVKLITAQYIPICNSYIYNGYKSTSVTIDI